jgi:hypothetical protein
MGKPPSLNRSRASHKHAKAVKKLANVEGRNLKAVKPPNMRKQRMIAKRVAHAKSDGEKAILKVMKPEEIAKVAAKGMDIDDGKKK